MYSLVYERLLHTPTAPTLGYDRMSTNQIVRYDPLSIFIRFYRSVMSYVYRHIR